MRFPSGDQAGVPSLRLPLVTCRRLVPSAFITQMCLIRADRDATAIGRPRYRLHLEPGRRAARGRRCRPASRPTGAGRAGAGSLRSERAVEPAADATTTSARSKERPRPHCVLRTRAAGALTPASVCDLLRAMPGDYLRSLNPRLPLPVWLLQVGGLMNSFGNGLVLPFLVIYLHNVRGFSLGTAGLVVAVSSFAQLVAGILAGPLIDRVGARPHARGRARPAGARVRPPPARARAVAGVRAGRDRGRGQRGLLAEPVDAHLAADARTRAGTPRSRSSA